MIYILEVNGQTNTARYVSNIGTNQIRVLTSKGSHYEKKVESPVFGNYRVANSFFKLFWYVIGWVRVLFKLSAHDDFHFHWLKLSPLDLFFLIILKKKKINLVCTVHNIFPHEESGFDIFFYGRIYKLVDHFVFHTEGIKLKFDDYFDIKASFTIISHYFDDVSINREVTDPKRMLFFGNIRPYKGLDLFIDALLRIPNSDWSALVAGKQEYDISRLQLKSSKFENIQWITNHIEEEKIQDMFNSSGIVVMPYLKIDTSGLLYLALSYKKVIIAPRMGIFEEILKDKVTGLLFEPGCVVDLQRAIDFGLDESNFRNIQNNIDNAFQSHSVDDFQLGHALLYDQLERGKEK